MQNARNELAGIFMGHIKGLSRYQTTLMPESLDELIDANNSVRVLNAFVDTLDMKVLGFARVVPARTGRPPYDPADLLKLYLYGYLHQVRSSRRLERECGCNLEVMWLMNRLVPDFKTIADFRKDHGPALVGVCRTFVGFCREQALFGAELVAIDGSKFQAVASRKQALTARQLEEHRTRLDEQIAQYLGQLDTADAAEQTRPAGESSRALAALEARRAELQALAAEMAARDRRSVVRGEPDAGLMHSGHGSELVAGYNVQSAVDAKHGLIAHHEVTPDANDHQHLYPIAVAAQAAIQAERLTVVADSGYHNGEQAAQCERAGITAIVPSPRTVNPHGDYFTKTDFVYDAVTDTYRCPAGATLTYRTYHTQEQVRLYATEACGPCPLRLRCTKGKRRMVARHYFADALEAMGRRARENPGWMIQRRSLAEHPFGTLKRWLTGGRFLVRGSAKVKGEMALAVTAYNLRRTLTILGVPALLQRFNPA